MRPEHIFISIDLNCAEILAYRIISSSEGGYINDSILIIEENSIYLIENSVPIKKWIILKTLYDSNGGEFITKEKETFFLSKNILIKKENGEEISYEYEPIDIRNVNINSEYLKL